MTTPSSLELSDLTPELLEKDPKTWCSVVGENISDVTWDRYNHETVYCDVCETFKIVQLENFFECHTENCKVTSCGECRRQNFGLSLEDQSPDYLFCNKCYLASRSSKKT